ncbi:MAG: RNA polymerase sigma factor [Vicinamibacterales bacterium]
MSVTTTPDDWLMVAVQRGDLDKLSVLFERYHRPLFGFFVRMTGDRHVSEDLVQDVFLRLLRFRHTYRPGSQFRTWLYEIARNVVRDRRHPAGRETELDPSVDIPVDGDAPVRAIAAAQEQQLLARALAVLPDDKREVIVLSRYQGMKYEDVAAVLGCQVGAVKVRVHRAMKTLRATVEALQEERGSWRATK